MKFRNRIRIKALRIATNALIARMDRIKHRKPKDIKPLPYTVITSIKDLLFSDFIKCVVHGQLSILIQSGCPTEEQLISAWGELLSQYYEATGDSKVGDYLDTARMMTEVALHINRIAGRIEAIRIAYGKVDAEDLQPFFDDLIEDGYEYEFLPDTIEKDLNSIESLEKRHRITYARLKAQYDRINTGNAKEITEDMFIDSLFDISKHEGINYKASEISTHEYCVLAKRLAKHNEYLKTQPNNV